MAPAFRSWIVLGQEGRHVTLGRVAPSTEEEIAAAGAAFAEQGLGGWVATLGGSYWARGGVTLTPARTIGGDTPLDWPAAFSAALHARQRARREA